MFLTRGVATLYGGAGVGVVVLVEFDACLVGGDDAGADGDGRDEEKFDGGSEGAEGWPAAVEDVRGGGPRRRARCRSLALQRRRKRCIDCKRRKEGMIGGGSDARRKDDVRGNGAILTLPFAPRRRRFDEFRRTWLW